MGSEHDLIYRRTFSLTTKQLTTHVIQYHIPGSACAGLLNNVLHCQAGMLRTCASL